MYERIVEAALNETRSIKDLAEALYEEIGDLNTGTVQTTFDRIIEAIQLAGGEPKHRSTLMQYWRTAQWLYDPATGEYGWADGVSFGTHNAARMAGMSLDELRGVGETTDGKATIEHVLVATKSRKTWRNRLDHDLARALKRFAENVERYMESGVITPDMVHWGELLGAYRRAEKAMHQVKEYIDQGEGNE